MDSPYEWGRVHDSMLAQVIFLRIFNDSIREVNDANEAIVAAFAPFSADIRERKLVLREVKPKRFVLKDLSAPPTITEIRRILWEEGILPRQYIGRLGNIQSILTKSWRFRNEPAASRLDGE